VLSKNIDHADILLCRIQFIFRKDSNFIFIYSAG